MSGKVLTGSARDCTTAEVASDPDREFQNGRNYYDAFGLVEQILRNTVRDVQNFSEDLSAGVEALLLPGFIGCENGTSQKSSNDKDTNLSHDTSPKTSARFLRTRHRATNGLWIVLP
jgi:hypothetical protein